MALDKNYVEELFHTDMEQYLSSIGKKTTRSSGSRVITSCVSPDHADKSPSMSIDTTTGVYHCHGCKISGKGAISLHAHHEGLNPQRDFLEAVNSLGSHLGKPPKYIDTNPEERGERERLFKALSAATKDALKPPYFDDDKTRVADYLKERSVTQDDIKKFGVGFLARSYAKSPSVKYNEQGMLEAGVVKESNKDGGGTYSPLGGRIIFPIHSHQGKVVALAGRRMPDVDRGPKYYNTQESPLFKKSHVLYGLYQAVQAMPAENKGKTDHMAVVEGYMDVIAAHRHGFTNTVATMGTALSDHHIRTLSRHTNTVVFVFDGDQAGHTASEKALMAALPHAGNMDFRFAFLPSSNGTKHDPDSFLKTYGPESYDLFLKQAIDMPQMAARYVMGEDPVHSLAGLLRSGASHRAEEVFDASPAGIVRTLVAHAVANDVSKALQLPVSPAELGMQIAREVQVKDLYAHYRDSMSQLEEAQARIDQLESAAKASAQMTASAVQAPVAPVPQPATVAQPNHQGGIPSAPPGYVPPQPPQTPDQSGLASQNQAANASSTAIAEPDIANQPPLSEPPPFEEPPADWLYDQPYADGMTEGEGQYFGQDYGLSDSAPDRPAPASTVAPDHPNPTVGSSTAQSSSKKSKPIARIYEHFKPGAPAIGDWIAIETGELLKLQGYSKGGMDVIDIAKSTATIRPDQFVVLAAEREITAKYTTPLTTKGRSAIGVGGIHIGKLPDGYMKNFHRAMSYSDERQKLVGLAMMTAPLDLSDRELSELRKTYLNMEMPDLRQAAGKVPEFNIEASKGDSSASYIARRGEQRMQESSRSPQSSSAPKSGKKFNSLLLSDFTEEPPVSGDWVVHSTGMFAKVSQVSATPAGQIIEATTTTGTPLSDYDDGYLLLRPQHERASKFSSKNVKEGQTILKLSGGWFASVKPEVFQAVKAYHLHEDPMSNPQLIDMLAINMLGPDRSAGLSQENKLQAISGVGHQSPSRAGKASTSPTPSSGDTGKIPPGDLFPNRQVKRFDWVTAKSLDGQVLKFVGEAKGAMLVQNPDDKTVQSIKGEDLLVVHPQAAIASKIDSSIAKKGETIFKFTKDSKWAKALPDDLNPWGEKEPTSKKSDSASPSP